MYSIDRLDQNILNKSKTNLLASFYIIIPIFCGYLCANEFIKAG